MELNSCLYTTRIMHHRLFPEEHKFTYNFFSFYLDLDEIDHVARNIIGFSHNKFNAYAFYEKDHVEKGGLSVKENVLLYLKEKGIELPEGKIKLLTFVRTFGYVFNPVSFYYCFDKNDRPVCVIPEIGNTFGELKIFMIDKNHLKAQTFKDTQDKFYYISPFAHLEDQLDFCLTIPGEKLNVAVDTSRDGKKMILTTMKGNRQELTNKNLLKLTAQFPLVTLKVITLIHWHALRLWMKGLPYEEKTSNPHLQKEVYRVWNKNKRTAKNKVRHTKTKYISKNH